MGTGKERESWYTSSIVHAKIYDFFNEVRIVKRYLFETNQTHNFLFCLIKLCKNVISCKGIRGRKVFSQNDEDGAIEDVFKHIGTTNKVI